MATMNRLPFSRYEFPELIDREGYKCAVEVGVNIGQFSYHLLKYSKLELLLSVDPYRRRFKSCMIGAQTLLEPFEKSGRSILWRLGSTEMAEELAAGTIGGMPPLWDFVYIDAAHDERSVMADLEAWYPLVRPGGILAGHDYCDAHRNGVIQAVNKFASNRGLEFSITREAWASFVFRIPMTRETT